ncbi:MAG: PDZ domain-containing protein, partial [Caldilineaceae bacterium SB0675_bin_29]|nr:PDZ domain-containing protein [Caldilineaceae bacterium SB0675_bin_29]
MRNLGRTISKRPASDAAKRKLWVVISLVLLASLVLGGTASASSVSERIKPQPGVLIVAVGEETPASEAGLARGDILLAIDGDMVNTAAELQHVILMRDPGDT